MSRYRCLICGTDHVQELETHIDGFSRACSLCGPYAVTRHALHEMEQHGYTFNVEISRSWLSAHQGDGEIPVIDWTIAAKLI